LTTMVSAMNRSWGATKAKSGQHSRHCIYQTDTLYVTRLTLFNNKKICILEHSHVLDSGPSQRVQYLKREVEQLYQNNIPSGKKFETEVFEMKRQLWLKACGRDNRSNDTTYGRAFVAPVLPGRNNSRYGNDDMRNLLEDIYDI